MLRLFKTQATSIISYLESNADIEKLLIGIPVNLDILMKLVNNSDITKVVFESISQKYVKIQQAFGNYLSSDQILIYVDMVDLYLLFDTVSGMTSFTNSLKNCSIKVNVYQIIKQEYKQKLILNIIDENCIKIAQSMTTQSELIIEKTNNFLWEITFNGVIYDNYDAVKKAYSDLMANIDQVYSNRIFLTPILYKKFDKYIRVNINSIYTNQTSKIIKNMVISNVLQICEPTATSPPVEADNTTKRIQTIIKNNQPLISWIHKNPPSETEQKMLYYSRYISAIVNDKNPSQSTFTLCVKNVGYDEVKKGGKLYWVMNRVSLS